MDQLNGPSPPRFRSPAEYLSGASSRCFFATFCFSAGRFFFCLLFPICVLLSDLCVVSLFSRFLPNAVRILRAHISVEYASFFSLFFNSGSSIPTIAACWLAANEHFLKTLIGRASVSRLSKKLTYGIRFGEVVGISLLTAGLYSNYTMHATLKKNMKSQPINGTEMRIPIIQLRFLIQSSRYTNATPQ